MSLTVVGEKVKASVGTCTSIAALDLSNASKAAEIGPLVGANTCSYSNRRIIGICICL
jgi:hypothetical protein